LYSGKTPAKVTNADIKAIFDALKSGKSLIFEVGAENENSETVKRKDKFYNILVIGRDKVALNTDVIICASFDTANKKAATVQIPRDSYVEDSKGVKSKINAVFARGYTLAKSELQSLKKQASGKNAEEIAQLCKKSKSAITPEMLENYISGKKTLADICTEIGIRDLQNVITRTFGIYFDYYAIVSTDAFVEIVDAIGGVDVYVQEPMHYDDPDQNLHIHINAGQQHLDGKKAEGFVRFRSGYVRADLARMDAQKIFMTAFFKKLLSFSSITKIDEIINTVYKNLDTDMTVENILAFVRPALSVKMSEITMLNMQGTAYNNGMYYSLNKAENLKIVNEHFNVFSHDLKPEAVYVNELVRIEQSDGYEGMTMEEIKDNQPHINFIVPKPSVKTEDKDEGEKDDTENTDETEKDDEKDPSEEPADENDEKDPSEDEEIKDGENKKDGEDKGESENKEDSSEENENEESTSPESKEEAPANEDNKTENSNEGEKEPLSEEKGKEE
jgi:LCP family protein required for cell wall assembly